MPTTTRFHGPTIYLLVLLSLATSVKSISIIALQRSDTKSNPSKNQKVELGRALFFDRRLSDDRTVSCATCHDPASAFTSRDAVPAGVKSQTGVRNAPTILNVAFSRSYFWDGRVATLEEQAKQPLLNSHEMDMKTETALAERVAGIDEYQQSFRRIFPREGVTIETIASAIAADLLAHCVTLQVTSALIPKPGFSVNASLRYGA